MLQDSLIAKRLQVALGQEDLEVLLPQDSLIAKRLQVALQEVTKHVGPRPPWRETYLRTHECLGWEDFSLPRLAAAYLLLAPLPWIYWQPETRIPSPALLDEHEGYYRDLFQGGKPREGYNYWLPLHSYLRSEDILHLGGGVRMADYHVFTSRESIREQVDLLTFILCESKTTCRKLYFTTYYRYLPLGDPLFKKWVGEAPREDLIALRNLWNINYIYPPPLGGRVPLWWEAYRDAPAFPQEALPAPWTSPSTPPVDFPLRLKCMPHFLEELLRRGLVASLNDFVDVFRFLPPHLMASWVEASLLKHYSEEALTALFRELMPLQEEGGFLLWQDWEALVALVEEAGTMPAAWLFTLLRS